MIKKESFYNLTPDKQPETVNEEVSTIDEMLPTAPDPTPDPTQNRFKSWALWTAIAALIVFCVKEFAGVDINDTVNGLLNVVLPVLVAFGVINDPTHSKHL